jgi:hypothetical protein
MSVAAPVRPHISPRLISGSTLTAFTLVLAGTLAVALLQAVKPFYYDSGEYWGLGAAFIKHGTFSLLNFESPLRGYLLPLIDHGLQAIATALTWRSSSLAKISNVVSFSFIGAVLAPKLAELTWPQRRWGVTRRIAIATLLIVFWGGYLAFPLSDFPALAMAMVALVAIARPDAPGWMLLAGAAVSASIDMRPSYLLLAPIMIAIVVLAWFGERKRKHASVARRASCMCLLIIGFAGVALPQSLSSHHHYGTYSFVPGSAANLTNLQLTEGLRLQRYETYVGMGHAPQMRYEDSAGTQLLSKQKDPTITGVSQYLGLIVDHPVVIAGLFARHVVNGLDQRYNTPYIEHLDTGSHRWLRLSGFLLVFFALARLLWPAARRRLGPTRWRYPVALALCCLTSVPSALETRYLLPVYVLSYILVLVPGWPRLSPPARITPHDIRTAAILAGACVAFMALVIIITSATSSHLTFG